MKPYHRIDGLRRSILVSVFSLACTAALYAQDPLPGNSITLRPVDTRRSIYPTRRDGTRSTMGRPASARNTYTSRPPRASRTPRPAGSTVTPRFAVKSNLIYAAAVQTPNLAFEYSPGGRWSVEASVGYNNWGNMWDNKTIGPAYDANNLYKRRLDHLFAKAGYRHWFRGAFDGHFVGAGLMYAHYRVGDVKFFNLFEAGYDYFGHLVGMELSWGWLLKFSRRWGAEFGLGVGIAPAVYKKGVIRVENGVVSVVDPVRESKTYFGPTSASIKIVFLID